MRQSNEAAVDQQVTVLCGLIDAWIEARVSVGIANHDTVASLVGR